MNIGDFFWDLDDMLVDKEPAHRAAFDAALQELEVGVWLNFNTSPFGVNQEWFYAAPVSETGGTISRSGWSQRKWARYGHRAPVINYHSAVADVALDLSAGGIPTAVLKSSTAYKVVIALPAPGLDVVLTTIDSIFDAHSDKLDPESCLPGRATSGFSPPPALRSKTALSALLQGGRPGCAITNGELN